MAHAALVSLAQSINQILNHDHSPPTLPVYQEIIRSIRDHAVDLQSFLEGFPEKTNNSLEGRIREVADTAEDVIEYLLLERNSSDRGSFERQLKQVAEKIKSTAGDVLDYVKINDSVNNSVRRRWSNPFVVGSSSRRRERRFGCSLFDFNEDVKVFLDWLLMGSSKLQVLSIVGMGGIGKTTLAHVAFNNASTVEHFDFRFWVTMSQDYSVESIVSKLLARMPKEEEARQYPRDGRYLIVMDNVCSKKDWDDIRKMFADDDNGSRIILTTRLQDVSCTHSHKMRFLTLDHSWALLQDKVFGDHQLCPPEMESAGREIAARCEGLPLSIAMVGGLLSKIDKTNHVWKQIAESTDGQLETVISLSYTHMPHHLKSCLLYVAAFPEYYGVSVSELTKLWVAEGFIKCRDESKSLEEEAEDYLEDLVERGLVLVLLENYVGNMKYCHLHDTVRDFCIRQCGQERILVPVEDYLPSPILRRHFLPRVLKNYKRLSASCYDLDLKDSMHSSHAHSIICLPKKGYRPKGSIQNFSLLRVLHVLRVNDYYNWEPGRVFDLIYLTYLAANIPSSIVPPAISKLQNLQTLIIYRHDVRLPVEIWRLRQLRHLVAFSFHPLPQPEGATPPLENLQTLSLARDFVCSGRMVEMIPNIQKLGICYSEERFGEVYHIINLRRRLLRLEKLKLEMDCSFRPPLNPFFPLSLKQLTLSGWGIPWRCMAIVGLLPNLQVLKLRKYACEGRCWKTSEGGFYALRMLLVDESNLQHWKLTDQSSQFPNLERLILLRCSYLSEIPTALGHIPALELIEVDNHNRLLYYSAKRIQEEQRRNGNESIQVLVTDV